MAKICCADCLPALLSSQLAQQKLEIALQRQQAEIIRLRFGLELRDLTASFSAPAPVQLDPRPDPETLSREMIRKYEAYSRSLKLNRRKNTPLRRSWEISNESEEQPPKRLTPTCVSKHVQTASLQSSRRRTASVSSASPPYPVFTHSSPEDLPLRSSSKLMSILRESELGPSLKASQPPITRLVNRTSMSFDMDDLSRTKDTPRPLHQITLEELMNSDEQEGFLPVLERDNRLFSEDGSEVTVTSVFGGTLSSDLKVYSDMQSALRASGAAVRLSFGDPRLQHSSRDIRPVEVLRRSQEGLARFALD